MRPGQVQVLSSLYFSRRTLGRGTGPSLALLGAQGPVWLLLLKIEISESVRDRHLIIEQLYGVLY